MRSCCLGFVFRYTCRTASPTTILSRWPAKATPELTTESRRRPKADSTCDCIDGESGLLEKLPRPIEAHREQPLSRRHPDRLDHVSMETADAESGGFGNPSKWPLFVKMRLDRVEQRDEPRSRTARDWPGDDLSLFALTVARENETPRNSVGDRRAEILPHDVKAKIESCSTSR